MQLVQTLFYHYNQDAHAQHQVALWKWLLAMYLIVNYSKGISSVYLGKLIERFVDKRSHLKTDELHAYKQTGKQYASHHWVNHHSKEFACGETYNNIA